MVRRIYIILLILLTVVSVDFGSVSAATGSSSAPTGNTGNTGDTAACESAGGVLDWVYCSIYDSITKITQIVLVDFLEPELKTPPICLGSISPGCTNPTYQIWSNFRIYGDIILVIALLVAIISEAIGGGLMDAYAVRKILPRILAAAILINLSIYIVAALLDITNIIGGGIGAIITAPIKNAGAFHIQANGDVTILATGGAFIMGGSVLVALFTHSGGALLVNVVIVPVLLILLSILITVTIRKAAIVALVIISPLAFAFYCLPNTEKYFKRWWSLLLEMLMVYPIIIVMFAVSSVMSAIVGTPGQGQGSLTGAVNAIMALVFAIIPLMLIPFSFKLAGDTIGRIHGAIEGGRSKISAMHEPIRKMAKDKFHGQVISNRANIQGRIGQSAAYNRLSSVPIIGGHLRGNVAKAEHQAELRATDVGQSSGGKAIQHNEDALRALTYGKFRAFDATKKELMDEGVSEEEAANRARKAVTAVNVSTGFGKSQAIWAAEQLGTIGTGYKDQKDMQKTIGRVADGSDSVESALSGFLNNVSKQVGRPGLAAGVGLTKDMAHLYYRESKREDVSDEIARGTAEGIEKGYANSNTYNQANVKPMDIKPQIEHYTNLLNSADEAERDKAVIYFKEQEHVIKDSGPGENRDLLYKALTETAGARAREEATLGVHNQEGKLIGLTERGQRIQAQVRGARRPDESILNSPTK